MFLVSSTSKFSNAVVAFKCITPTNPISQCSARCFLFHSLEHYLNVEEHFHLISLQYNSSKLPSEVMRAFVFLCVLTAAKATRGHPVAGAHVSGATGESSRRARQQQDAIFYLARTQHHDSAAAAAVATPGAPTPEQSLALRRKGKPRRLLGEGNDNSSSRSGWQRNLVGGTRVRGGGGTFNKERIGHDEEDEEGKREQRMVRSVLLYYPNLIGRCVCFKPKETELLASVRGCAGLLRVSESGLPFWLLG